MKDSSSNYKMEKILIKMGFKVCNKLIIIIIKEKYSNNFTKVYFISRKQIKIVNIRATIIKKVHIKYHIHKKQ